MPQAEKPKGVESNILSALQQRLVAALTGLVEDPLRYAVYVKPGQVARGDYQIEAKCFFELAKVLKRNNAELAREVVARMQLSDLFEPPAISGPGFVNLNVRNDWLASRVRHMEGDERLGIEPPAAPRTYVIDYSSPNVAKPLHVGHLRSTIIGDALTRLLRFLGHKVITDNHLGDWGTQFGILLYGYKNFLDRAAYERDPVGELARLYVHVRSLVPKKGKDEDDEPAGDHPVEIACRAETAKLHAGDPENVQLWQEFMPHGLALIEAIYRRLGVLPFDYQHGESFYNPMLADVVEEMLARGIGFESQGAIVIPNARGIVPTTEEERAKEEPPAVIRKRDGAFTYTTSDLATLKYRMEHFHPDVVLYLVGLPQSLHFKTLFAQARRWGYDKVALEHVAFGSVLGPDRKPYKTREGKAESLDDLLTQAIAQAAVVYEAKRKEAIEGGEDVPDFSEKEKRDLYEVVGIGAVKYADLSQNRTSDYVFDPVKMTSTVGNTATYMQYAYVRNRGIFRRGEIDVEALRHRPPAILLCTPQERTLAMQLARLPEVLDQAAADSKPNLITAYLWDLANAYSSFFENCPVLRAETPELRQSRLALCDLTARVIQKGLDLLGIRTIERM
jgi:arginyl-tRNA synthetase